jgi:hypothetical protein
VGDRRRLCHAETCIVESNRKIETNWTIGRRLGNVTILSKESVLPGNLN